MNGRGFTDHTSREIARGLIEVVEAALHPSAPVLSASAAREVARLLELRGLERVLACVEAFGARRPHALGHVLERIERLLAAARARESVEPFVEADAELLSHAETLENTRWSEPESELQSSPVAAIGLGDALAGWPLQGIEGDPPLVSAPVASALRAALDWLAVEPGVPLGVEVHDDFVALLLDVHQGEGLVATGDVLETVGGHLSPIRPGSRRWRLVVPRLVARRAFLLLEQGALGLALPWSSVVRLRMLSADRAGEEAPVLAPLRSAAPTSGERPAALIAHGLRRAWLLADRVVWRFAAHTEEPDSLPPVSGLACAVRDDDDTLFWVADPAWLLRAVEAGAPHIDEAAPTPAPALEVEPISSETDGTADPTPPASIAPMSSESSDVIGLDVAAETESAPVAFEPEAWTEPASSAPDTLDVEPLDFEVAPIAPLAADFDDEADDAPIEWLVHSSANAVPAAPVAPPVLTLLGPDDVEPLEDASPAEDAATAGSPSRIARALARLEASIDDTMVYETADVEPHATILSEPEAATPGAGPAPDSPEPPTSAALAEPDDVEPATGPETLAEAAPTGEVSHEPLPTLADEPAAAVEDLAPTPAAPAAEAEPDLAPVLAAAPATAPLTTPAPAEPVSPAPGEPIPLAPLEITSRLALVAEDSMVASIFLQRLLEQRGFRAVAVEMALDLARELPRGAWGLVCVDVHLPDASGAAHLEAVARAVRESGGDAAVIALTRDAEDEKLAAAAGVVHHLRKPFEAGAVDRLFAALGLPVRKGRA